MKHRRLMNTNIFINYLSSNKKFKKRKHTRVSKHTPFISFNNYKQKYTHPNKFKS